MIRVVQVLHDGLDRQRERAAGVVRRSPNGLIAVHVDAGDSEVRLAYRAPFALVAVYWLTWACWAGLIIGALRAHWRR